MWCRRRYTPRPHYIGVHAIQRFSNGIFVPVTPNSDPFVCCDIWSAPTRPAGCVGKRWEWDTRGVIKRWYNGDLWLPLSRTWTLVCGTWRARRTTRYRPRPISCFPGRTTVAARRIDRHHRPPATWTGPFRTPWRFSVCTALADSRRSRPKTERCRPCACEIHIYIYHIK